MYKETKKPSTQRCIHSLFKKKFFELAEKKQKRFCNEV